MSRWVFISMSPDHKHWGTFSKVIKLPQLEVDSENLTKDIVIKVPDKERSIASKTDIHKTYRITNEYISDEVSMLGFYEKRKGSLPD